MTQRYTGVSLNYAPYDDCEGCRTTGGKMCCWRHGWSMIKYIYNNPLDSQDNEVLEAIERINYGKVLSPIE